VLVTVVGAGQVRGHGVGGGTVIQVVVKTVTSGGQV
jgi:hypothetical protein